MPRVPHLHRVAFHEAGHAVVAQALGARVVRATIVPQSDFVGQVRHEFVATDEVFILIAFAGPHAEARYHGPRPRLALGCKDRPRSGRDVVRYGASFDVEQARHLACRQKGWDREERRAYLRWAWQRARLLVTARWTEVEAVAAALLERRTLTGDQVRAVIRRTRF